MVNLLEITACSGAKWDESKANRYILDSKTIASEFNQSDLKINSVTHVDGISSWPISVSKNLNYYYGSGSIIINTENLGNIAVTVNPRYDSNLKNSHIPKGIHLNINLPWYQDTPSGLKYEGEIQSIKKYKIHGTPSKRGIIKLTDLYNGDHYPFSDHVLVIKSITLLTQLLILFKRIISFVTRK